MATLQGAVDALAATDALDVVAVSPVVETDPVGGPEQPDFLNAVLVAETTLSPRDLLERAHAVEAQFGRVRLERWGPRTLDVDVIAAWTDDGAPIVSGDPALTLPHPRAHLRAFVLRPWIDIMPYGQLPGHGALTDLMRADAVLADLPGVRPRADLALES